VNRRHCISLYVALCLAVLPGTPARADRTAYRGVLDISAETVVVRAEHHHDWSKRAHGDPFAADNDYSYLMLRDKATGAEIFRRPVPALTYLWISPDSKYIVGVSNVMLWNPHHLVVFNRSGDRLLERDMVDVKWPGIGRSVTNWIY